MLEAESSLENTPGSTLEIIGVGSAKYAPGGALKRILDIALAVTGSNEAEGNAVLIGLEGVAESGPHDGDLALAADLRPHAARAVEHDDGR